MAGEPWCFSPDQIARLTDYQIDELYLEPAARKGEAMERERKGLPPLPPPGPVAEESMTAPPHRETVVATAVAAFGMSREKAEADYDRQLAAWTAQNAKG